MGTTESAIVKPGEVSEVIKTRRKYGLVVPKTPRKQAIFYNKSLDVEKILKIKDAIAEGATWRAAAMQAGMYPSEFEYMIKLGRAGHPAYGKLVSELLEARGAVSRKMFDRMLSHAMSEEGVTDGTLEKMIKAEERDSWIETGAAVSGAGNVSAQVNINVNFGDEKTVDHSDVEDAEFEEVDE